MKTVGLWILFGASTMLAVTACTRANADINRDEECRSVPGHPHAFECVRGEVCSFPKDCKKPQGDASVCCAP